MENTFEKRKRDCKCNCKKKCECYDYIYEADYVIVGIGTAGSVFAKLLSDDKKNGVIQILELDQKIKS